MKKVKTLVTIIALLVVSFLAPACSCGGPEEEIIPQVAANGISIRLVEESSDPTVKVVSTPGDMSGKLSIECEEGDEFVLEYTITPADTTKTKVNWAFDKQGVVSPYLNEGYTRNNTAVEKVKFKATDSIVGDNNVTELTFATTEHFKEASCIIEVKIPAAERSTLFTPKNLKFNAETNMLTWDKVTQMTNIRGVPVNIAGNEIDSYEITAYESNYNSDLARVENIPVSREIIPASENSYEIENGFEAGKQYVYSVRAIGNPSLANNSEDGPIYKFYKLKPATNVKNVNGEIFFTPVEYTEDVRVYLNDRVNQSVAKPVISDINTPYSFNHKSLNSANQTLNIQFVSYPCDVSDYPGTTQTNVENTGYPIKNPLDSLDITHYFASDKTEALTVYKLKAPKNPLSIETGENRTITLASQTFSVVGSNYIQISDELDNNPSDVGLYYVYDVYDYVGSDAELKNANPINSKTTTNGIVDLEQLNLDPGAYTMVVWSRGNENTIDSKSAAHSATADQFKRIDFSILPETQKIQLNGDTLAVSTSTGNSTRGFEIIFVNTSNPEASAQYRYNAIASTNNATIDIKSMQTADGETIQLASGTYNIYAIPFCNIVDAVNLRVLKANPTGFSTVYESQKVFKDLKVLEEPKNVKVTPEGVLEFDLVSNCYNYNVTIDRTFNGNTTSHSTFIYKHNESDPDLSSECAVYTTSGTKASISLKTIFEFINTKTANGDKLTFDQFFTNGCSFRLKMYTEGTYSADNGADTAISSNSTGLVNFTVQPSATALTLNDYVLTITISEDLPTYTINLYSVNANGEKAENPKASETVEDMEGNTINLLDVFPLETLQGKIYIEVVSEGSLATVMNSGKLSATSSVTISFEQTIFDTTTTPTALNIVGDNLVWKTGRNFGDDVAPSKFTYTIRFYAVDTNGATSELDEDKITGNTNKTKDETSGDTVISVPDYYCEVASILAKYPGQVIGMTVQEINSEMFTAAESAMIFATRTAAVANLKWSTVDATSENIILWDAVSGAEYYVSVSGAKTINPETIAINSYSITNKINDRNAPWTEGTYTIHVSNNLPSGGGSRFDTPITLASEKKSISVVLLNSEITVSASDYAVTWENPTHEVELNTDYNISFVYTEITAAPEEGGEPIVEAHTVLTKNIVYTAESELMAVVMLDTLAETSITPRTYSVTVTPSIAFANTGYIYIGDTKTNTIKKLNGANVVATSLGNLQVVVNEVLVEGNYEFELYEVDAVSGELGSKPVSLNDYKKDPPVIDEEEKTTTFNLVLSETVAAGAHTYCVKIKSVAANCISGNISTAPATPATKLSALNIEAEYDGNGKRFITWKGQRGLSKIVIDYYYGTNSETPEAPITLTMEYVVNQDDTYGYTNLFYKSGDNELSNPNVFKYADGKFYFYFDETVFVKENIGDISLTLTPFTDVEHFLNGNVSNEIVITKLNNSTDWISISDGKVSIADYLPNGVKDAADFNAPLSYTVAISPLIEKEVTVPVDPENPDGDTKTTIEHVKIKDTNDKDITFTAGENGIIPYVQPAEGTALYTVDLNNVGYKLVNDTTFKFDAATDTDVTINGTKYTIVAYRVELTFNSDTKHPNIISSKTVYYDCSKLNKSSQLSTVDGDLQWSAVTGATEYILSITDPQDKELQFNVGDVTKLSQATLTLDEGAGDEDNDDNGGTSTTATSVFIFAPSTNYTVKIKALNPGTHLSSDWSTSFIVHKLAAPSDVAVSTSTDTTDDKGFGAPIITWKNTNVDASGNLLPQKSYEIDYIKAGASSGIIEIPVNGSTFSTLVKPLAADTNPYYVQIKIIGNSSAQGATIGYLSSELNASTNRPGLLFIDDVDSLEVVDATEADEISNRGMIQWSNWKSVDKADYFVVTIERIDDENTFAQIARVSTTNTSFDIANFASIEAGKTYRVTVNAVTNPINAIITNKAVDSNIEVYRPYKIDTFKVVNGALYWEITKDDVDTFIRNNKLTAYSAKAVLESVANSINTSGATSDTFAHLYNANLTINGVTTTVRPDKAEVLYDASKTDVVAIGYHYSLTYEPEYPNTNNNSDLPPSPSTEMNNGKYDITVTTGSNKDNNAAVIQGVDSSLLTVYKPRTPKLWTDAKADIVDGFAQWELSTTIDSSYTGLKFYKDYELYAVNGERQTALVKVNIDDLLIKHSEAGNVKMLQNHLFSVNLKLLFTTEEMIAFGQGTLAADEKNLLLANSDYQLFVRAIGTADSGALGFTGPKYLNSSFAQFNEVVNVLDRSVEPVIAANNLTWDTEYGSTATRVFVYGPYDNLMTETKDQLDENWYSNNATIAEEIQAMEAAYLADGTTNTMMNVFELGLEDGDTEDAEKKRIRTFSLTGRKQDDNHKDAKGNAQDFLPGGYVIRLQELGNNKGVMDSFTTVDVLCHKLGFGINNPIPVGGDGYSLTRITQKEGWVGIKNPDNSNDCFIYTYNASTDKWDRQTNKGYIHITTGEWRENIDNLTPPEQQDWISKADQTTGNFVWNPVAGANQYLVEIFYQPKEVTGGELIPLDNIKYYVRSTTFTLPDGTIYNNPDNKYSIRITPQRSATADEDYTNLADGIFYAESHDTTAHERLNAPQDVTVAGTGVVTATITPNYEYGYYGTDSKTRIFANYRSRFNADDELTALSLNMGVGTDKDGYLDFSEQNYSGTLNLRVKTMARSGAVNIEEQDGVVSKIFLNSGYTDSIEITKHPNANARIEDGDFNWGGAEDPKVTSSLIIDTNGAVTYGNYDNNGDLEYIYNQFERLYTNITEHNASFKFNPDDSSEEAGYTSTKDEDKYAVGTHTFMVKYDGSDGSIMATSADGKTFYVTSNYVTVSAYKMPAPEPVKGNTTTGNILKWAHIVGTDETENVSYEAEGYRVRFFGVANAAPSTIDDDSTPESSINNYYEIKALYSDILRGANGFSVVTENEVQYVVLNIAEAVQALDLGDMGGQVFAYVQAIGSGMVIGNSINNTGIEQKLLSSSYSTPVVYGIPSPVVNLGIDDASKALTWEVAPEQAKDMFIQINAKYHIYDVTEAQANVWGRSSDDYYVGDSKSGITKDYKDQRYSEINYRKVTSLKGSNGNFNLEIIDTVILVPEGDKKVTPTKYPLTSIGVYQEFELYVMTFDPRNTTTNDESYISSPTVLTLVQGHSFGIYAAGEGTTYNPYIINNASHLVAVKQHLDRHYILGANITLSSAWNTLGVSIESEDEYTPFTGTIDGKGHSINNYKVIATTYNNTDIMSFAYELGEDAYIKNINFNIADSGITSTGWYSVQMGVVTNRNYGTIENVAVNGNIIITTYGNGGYDQEVAGIALSNYGVINNVSVLGNITSLIDNDARLARAAGIVAFNYNVISDAKYYNDKDNNPNTPRVTIKSNYVAGLVNENYGSIDRSYVNEGVIINAVDFGNDSSVNNKTVVAGGFVGSNVHDDDGNGLAVPSITNSYSRANISLSIRNTKDHTVAGFVASVADEGISIANCFAVVNISGTSGTASVYNFIQNNFSSGNLINNYYIVHKSIAEDRYALTGVLERLEFDDSENMTETTLISKLTTNPDSTPNVDSQFIGVDGKARLKPKN